MTSAVRILPVRNAPNIKDTNSFSIKSFIPLLRFRDPTQPTPEEVELRQRFLARYPDQVENLLSYQLNPGCSCAGKIAHVISGDPEGPEKVISALLGRTVTVRVPKRIGGKVFIIDDTPEAWEEFVKRSVTELNVFRGVSIVPADGKLRLFVY